MNKRRIVQKYSRPGWSKSGSFSLEITIVFPLIAAVLFCFVWQMTATRCEMLFRSIIVKEAEKISFLGVLSEYAPALYQTATGTFPDSQAMEFAIDQILEISLKNQIQDHYRLLCEKNRTFRSLITTHTEFIECSVFDDEVTLTSVYSIYTPFRILRRQFTIPLRLWDHGDHSGKIDDSAEDNIWDYDNFKRGQMIRRRFGGNLPFGFPVLSGYSNGNILIIKSMDLTATTWDSMNEVRIQMQKSVDAVSSYQGMTDPWGEAKIIIHPSDIRDRFVTFVFPENTEMEKYASMLDEIKRTAEKTGVWLDVIYFQESRKNIEEP